ncbi:MAG: DUF488 domain-containing protein [Blastocatellia bacterium]
MQLYTIGHSNAESAAFVALLQRHDIELLVDTRSQPYSRYTPQFNRETLKATVNSAGIAYAFLGDTLGGRPVGEQFYFPSGKVDYDLLEQAEFYQSGVEKLLALAAECRVAFLCSEADYHHCHRYHLITRTLVRRGFEVKHILHSGELDISSLDDFYVLQQVLF